MKLNGNLLRNGTRSKFRLSISFKQCLLESDLVESELGAYDNTKLPYLNLSTNKYIISTSYFLRRYLNNKTTRILILVIYFMWIAISVKNITRQ